MHIQVFTVSFDAFRMVAGRQPCVSSGTDASPVNTDGSALAVVEFRTAVLVKLPCMDHTQTRIACYLGGLIVLVLLLL